MYILSVFIKYDHAGSSKSPLFEAETVTPKMTTERSGQINTHYYYIYYHPTANQICQPDHKLHANTLLCLLSLHRECCRFFGDDGLTPRVFFTKVAPFGLLWVLTNYLYLQALRKINTTDASALFCCNKAFVFLLSWIVLRDRFMGVRVSPSVPVTHGANLKGLTQF